jgi:hypothetical protein
MKRTLHSVSFIISLNLICLLSAAPSFAQVQTGKSYINVSKKSTGGTFEPGDTLEIRSAIAVGQFSAYTVTQVRYNDTIGANFLYVPGSLKIITNEGLTFRSFTDAAGDDPGMYDATNNDLRINLGSTATAALNTTNIAASGGTIVNTNKPSFYGGVCIMVASFRIVIGPGVPYNTLLHLPGGAFRFKKSGAAITADLKPYDIFVFQNYPSCSNFVGSNAIIENNGTFGAGTTQNRNASAIIPGYTFINFAANQPNDGFYGIANNTSATGASNNAVPISDASRVFGIWDIIGDHTGAASPTAGNPAVTPGSPGGYMAIVNASYATDPAIQQTVANLCTNTYYDFTAWFRNICSLCACDSNGRGANDPLFNGPYQPGVNPNLTFQLDGIDYYSTGEIEYSGIWEKKGFTYLTGPGQSSFTLTIRNNSPGGGGNDWAVDDVTLAACEPNVSLNITPVLNGCDGIQVDFNATVTSYFPNYTNYKWQKSTDNGVTWYDTGISGIGTPTLVGGQWEYTAVYPSFIAHVVDSGHRYRLSAATNAGNLASTNCAFNNKENTMLNIIDCSVVLKVKLLQFNGSLVNKKTNLKWISSNESNFSHYEIEKSMDGRNFNKIGIVEGTNRSSVTTYNYIDIDEVNTSAYYRLKMVDADGLFKFSEIILVSPNKSVFTLSGYTNPFRNYINLDYTLPGDGKVSFRIIDMYGKTVFRQAEIGKKDLNKIKLDNLGSLSAGIYSIIAFYENESITKRILKVD